MPPTREGGGALATLAKNRRRSPTTAVGARDIRRAPVSECDVLTASFKCRLEGRFTVHHYCCGGLAHDLLPSYWILGTFPPLTLSKTI